MLGEAVTSILSAGVTSAAAASMLGAAVTFAIVLLLL